MTRLLAILALLFYALPALAQDSAEAEKSYFLQYVESQLSTPDRRIAISGISGVLSSSATIAEITVADREGVWLRILNAAIDWNRSALLLGRLDVNRLAAGRIEMLRKPLPAEGMPAPEAGAFQLPELPLSIRLRSLDVPEIAFGEEVFGLAARLKLEGAVSLADGSLDTALDIVRLDGPGGTFKLAAKYANATRVLDLDLALAEPADGVVANLLAVDGRPPVAMTVKGAGPLDALDVALTLDAAQKRVLSGTARLRRQDGSLGFTADLGGPVAALVPAKFRDFFGADTRLTASGAVRDEGGMTLDALNLAGGALSLSGSAETSRDGFLRRLKLDGAIAAPAGGRVLLPVPGGATFIDGARLALAFGDDPSGRWTGRLAVDNLATEAFAAKSVALDLGGLAEHLDTPTERRVTFAVAGKAAGLTATRADIAEALGSEVDVEVAGDWQAGRPVALSRALIAGNGLTLSAAGTIAEAVFDGALAVDTATLAPFSGLAGRDLSGALRLVARGTLALVGGGFDLALDGKATDLAVGTAAADNLLAGATTITGRVVRDENGLAADNLRLENAQMAFAANGRFATAATDFGFDASLADLARLSPRASGRLTATGRAKGADGRLALTLDARVPQGSLAARPLSGAVLGFDGTLAGGNLAGKVAGSARLGTAPVRLSGDVALAEGAMRLAGLAFSAGATRLTGDLARSAEGRFAGRLALDSADVSTAAALLLVEAGGTAKADITLADTDGRQDAALSAKLDRLVVSGNRIGAADLSATVADLFGVPAIDGKVTARDLEVAKIAVATLAATASRKGEAIDFTADTALKNGAHAALAGALAPEGRGYRLSLSRADLRQGRLAVSLARPASLKIEGENVAIDDFALDAAGGRVEARGRIAETLDLEVAIRALPLAIANAVRPDLALSGTLDGSASVSGSRTRPSARFELAGRALSAAALKEAGISALTLAARGTSSGDSLALDATAASPEGLDARLSGRVPFSGSGLAVDVAGTAPLALANRFLAERGSTVSGTLTFDAKVSGSAAKPAVAGSFRTSGARFVDPGTNLRLNDIAIDAAISGETVTLRSASAALGSGGTVRASGTLSTDAASGFPADIRIVLDRARYADGNLVVATLSGNLAVAGALSRDPLLSGRIDVERAEISVPEQLGGGAAGVAVEHRNPPPAVARTLKRARADDGTPVPTARPSVARLDLTVSAPRRIFVRGRGLDAELGGTVRLTGPVTAIQPVGSFKLVRGRLSIIGQRITFDEGEVTLVGDLDPMLNFVARSEGTDITVFITVSGRVSDPSVTFSSQPELPQDEVLARLVFNRGIDELSPLQIAQLAAAAAELAGGSNTSLLGSLRQATGLDDLDVVTDKTGQTAVRAGRYIQENIYLGVEAGAGGTTRGTVNLDITPSLKAKGSLGSDGDSSLGLFFEKDY